jgi:hypothetical protein
MSLNIIICELSGSFSFIVFNLVTQDLAIVQLTALVPLMLSELFLDLITPAFDLNIIYLFSLTSFFLPICVVFIRQLG